MECVDAGPILARGPFLGKPSGLWLGGVYTIKAIHPKGSSHQLGGVWRADAVDLHETAHPMAGQSFLAKRFRLLRRPEPKAEVRRSAEPATASDD